MEVPSENQDKCAKCSELPSKAGPKLKRCSRCKTTAYCNKECQKAHWKQHKKHCAEIANEQPSPTSSTDTEPFVSSKPSIEAMLGHNTKTWLLGRPEKEVYTLLIDSYRMRIQDEYMFRGTVPEDSLYGGGDPLKGFKHYLIKTEKHMVLLPVWWSITNRKACIAQGDDKNEWSCLHFAVTKHSIQEHYGVDLMPMLLRMLAEEILGWNVMA